MTLERAVTGSGRYEPAAVTRNLEQLATKLADPAANASGGDRTAVQGYAEDFRELAADAPRKPISCRQIVDIND